MKEEQNSEQRKIENGQDNPLPLQRIEIACQHRPLR